jgi:hypothetical protein
MTLSSESILDHIADYLTFISNTQSFWFTLNTSYNHGCHLASRFCLEPNDYKVLLVVTGLALYTQLGFAIKPTAWRKFLGGHRFVTIALLSWNKKRLTSMHTSMGLRHGAADNDADDDADINADDNTETQTMDNDVDNDLADDEAANQMMGYNADDGQRRR